MPEDNMSAEISSKNLSLYNKFLQKGPVKANPTTYSMTSNRPKTGVPSKHKDSYGHSSMIKSNNFFKENQRIYGTSNTDKLLSRINKGL